MSEDLVELLTETLGLIKCLRKHRDQRECRATLVTCNKALIDLSKRLAMLLNTFNTSEMRQVSLGWLYQLINFILYLFIIYIYNILLINM